MQSRRGYFTLADEKSIAGQSLAQLLDVRDANLTAFERRGGKLLMYSGWADAVLAPRAGLAYYERVSRRVGGLAQTQRFFRLFMVPGMTHCQGGPAPDAFGQSSVSPGLSDDPRHDIRRALERWVEHGDASGSLVAVKHRGHDARQGPEATQLLCPFPQSAQIATAGDLPASSYACSDPRGGR
ncbi:MAG: tannase/feruloyl esterase family alpha/beta hydrolase [Steroidobacteraceae bacterium]